LFEYQLDDLCKNCLVLDARIDITDKAGKRIDLSSQVYNHHVVLTGTTEKPIRPVLMPGGLCVGKYPDLQQMANGIAGQFGVAAPDLTKLANSFGISKLPDLNELASQIGSQIGNLAGSLFGSPQASNQTRGAAPPPAAPAAPREALSSLGGSGSFLAGLLRDYLGLGDAYFRPILVKGHEGNHVQFAPSNNSAPMSGLWIGKGDKIMNSVELVNYKDIAQDVYFTMDMEYLSYDKKPDDILDVTFTAMFAADCADIMMSQLLLCSMLQNTER
jgi:hypothetical protein